MAKSLVNKLGTKKRDLQLFSKKKQNKFMKSKNNPDLRTEEKSSRCGRRNRTRFSQSEHRRAARDALYVNTSVCGRWETRWYRRAADGRRAPPGRSAERSFWKKTSIQPFNPCLSQTQEMARDSTRLSVPVQRSAVQQGQCRGRRLSGQPVPPKGPFLTPCRRHAQASSGSSTAVTWRRSERRRGEAPITRYVSTEHHLLRGSVPLRFNSSLSFREALLTPRRSIPLTENVPKHPDITAGTTKLPAACDSGSVSDKRARTWPAIMHRKGQKVLNFTFRMSYHDEKLPINLPIARLSNKPSLL